MSNWINDLIASTYDQYSEAIKEQLDTESTLTKTLKKKYPELKEEHHPTRHDMYLVHANMFMEAFLELRKLFEEMGTPISFYADDMGLSIQVGSVTLDL